MNQSVTGCMRLFATAVDVFSDLGYTPIDVPWLVRRRSILSTLPPDKHNVFRMIDGSLSNHSTFPIGSAEQGFVQMMLTGKLSPGKYQAISPCFRNEEVSDIHQLWFMKLELISYFGMLSHPQEPPDEDAVDMTPSQETKDFRVVEIASHAKTTMMCLGAQAVQERTPDGLDLMINGIEVGSYGYREFEGHHWVYGTGLALPRFNYAKGRPW